jgi:hypothetical protein
MARLGHTSARAAMVYQHASAERDRRIAERLTEMVAEEGAGRSVNRVPVSHEEGHVCGTRVTTQESRTGVQPRDLGFLVVGRGVDPRTSRFSGARSTS